MKRVIDFVMPIKVFAAMMFFGLIVLYVLSGMLYSTFTGQVVEYAVPFVFIFQSLGLSIVIALLWPLFFSETFIKKWRFFQRYSMFAVSMFTLLVACFYTFLAVPTEWARFWLLATLAFFAGTTVFFSLNELYYRKTGERYMEILNAYKSNLSQ